jgi:hypothetical protein
MSRRARLGPLGVPFQRGHFGNVHLLGQLGHAPFADGVGVGIPIVQARPLRPAVRLVGRRQRNSVGFRRAVEIPGPDPLLAFVSCHGRPGN